MRLPLCVGFGISLAAAVANAETSATTPSPSDHHFKLEFQETAIPEMGPVRDKFMSEGIFAGLLAEIEKDISLPQDVPVTFRDCGEANAMWDPSEKSLTMCYEMIQMYNTGYEAVMGEESVFLAGVDRDTVLTGTTLFILMHELGHGFIDMFAIPATGREEDAVDQFATLLLIDTDEKGTPVLERLSRMALLGAYFFKAVTPTGLDRPLLADEHSLGEQRYFNVMCLVYGSDPEAYGPILLPAEKLIEDLIGSDPGKLDPEKQTKAIALLQAADSMNILPLARAAGCPAEFKRYEAAWTYLIETFALKAK